MTSIQAPITVKQRVGIALWWLANTLSYMVLGHLFGVRSVVARIVIDVCLAMEAELLSSVVQPGPPL